MNYYFKLLRKGLVYNHNVIRGISGDNDLWILSNDLDRSLYNLYRGNMLHFLIDRHHGLFLLIVSVPEEGM